MLKLQQTLHSQLVLSSLCYNVQCSKLVRVTVTARQLSSEQHQYRQQTSTAAAWYHKAAIHHWLTRAVHQNNELQESATVDAASCYWQRHCHVEALQGNKLYLSYAGAVVAMLAAATGARSHVTAAGTHHCAKSAVCTTASNVCMQRGRLSIHCRLNISQIATRWQCDDENLGSSVHTGPEHLPSASLRERR
jgi:hypothetical protein